MRKYTDKEVQLVGSAIASAFETLHFLEEVKKLNVFNHLAKKNLNRTLDNLIEIEQKFYDPVTANDTEDYTDKLMSTKLTFLEYMLKNYKSTDQKKLQEIFVAFHLDRNRLVSISDKIHLKNGAEKI